MTFENIILIAAGTLAALFAGLLYAFSVVIVPTLRKLKSVEHISAMQAINVYIENPVFFLSFFGPVLLLPLAAFLHRGEPQFVLLVTAAIIQILGANGVTVAGNIPLNNKLATINPNKLSEQEADQIRQEFQAPGTPWMRLHAIRTLAATTSTVLVFIACLSK